jgi:hypothetical protein
MSWRLVAPLIVVAMACGNDKSKLDSAPPAGPVFMPSIAYALRAIAPDCKLEKTAAAQTRDCTGRLGTVTISLGEGDHFRRLTITLRAMITPEAKARLVQPLLLLLGDAGRDQVFAKLDQVGRGQTAELDVDKVKVTITGAGNSPIGPAYTVDLIW